MNDSPTANPDDLRRALRGFASGVTVVTSLGHLGEPVGMTVSAFSSVSLSPPLVLVCLYRETETMRAIDSARLFAVSILAEGQDEVSRRFAARDIDRFRGVAWHAGRAGMPLIDGALAHLECSVHAVVPGGDHDVILGAVSAAVSRVGRPLVYCEGSYHRLPTVLSR